MSITTPFFKSQKTKIAYNPPGGNPTSTSIDSYYLFSWHQDAQNQGHCPVTAFAAAKTEARTQIYSLLASGVSKDQVRHALKVAILLETVPGIADKIGTRDASALSHYYGRKLVQVTADKTTTVELDKLIYEYLETLYGPGRKRFLDEFIADLIPDIASGEKLAQVVRQELLFRLFNPAALLQHYPAHEMARG
ncbi:hypothetical protein [Ferrimonas marina]|uniref:Uncharacterized protein n=1 Tax=Ferrimonas marina TaxID=299255 RepID=A0A1M5ULP2_9GAMM|nr:hypothetical protein [Ferrimonas marina]SHH63788.1 hypothetical protein SAMN02745129_2625 [Ferrimonas marina]